MILIVLQLLVLGAWTAGMGYWFWLALGRPDPLRQALWVWCGLAGFCSGALLLQGLVYFDQPLRRTAPALAVLALGGIALLARRLWQRRSEQGRIWRAVFPLGAAALAAMALHSISVVQIGPARFAGEAQIDQVNYVALAQFLAEEPFSTRMEDIGLRPWMMRALELKNDRITDTVTLGALARLTGMDAQAAWGTLCVYATGLLALALGAMWQGVLRLGGWSAALLGLAGSMLPIVTYIFLVSFFSQLMTLFVFPALFAVCWPGALSRRNAAIFAATFLGFLLGAYTDFWPIGVAIAGCLILGWSGGLIRSLVTIATVSVGSVIWVGAYASRLPEVFLHRSQGMANGATRMSGFAPDGISWRGWGHNFVEASPSLAVGAGLAIIVGLGLAFVRQPRHRQWRFLLAWATPLGMLAWLFLRAEQPTYVIYKLLAAFSPILAGFAAMGYWQLVRHKTPATRTTVLVLLGFMAVWAAGSSLAGHLRLERSPGYAKGGVMDKLWAARERVASATGKTYLVDAPSTILGAWLTYFGRAAAVYYYPPGLSDRRAPTESFQFRRVPAGVPLEWLTLDRIGPVTDVEPTPVLHWSKVRASFRAAGRAVCILGRDAQFSVERSGMLPSPAGEWLLTGGIMPLPGVGPCQVTLRHGESVLADMEISGTTRLQIPLPLATGRQDFTLQVRPRPGAAGGVRDGDLVILQAVSLETPENAARVR